MQSSANFETTPPTTWTQQGGDCVDGPRKFPMRFDGETLDIKLDVAALVTAVAHGGTALPSYPTGAKLLVRMPVRHSIPQANTPLVGIAVEQLAVATPVHR